MSTSTTYEREYTVHEYTSGTPGTRFTVQITGSYTGRWGYGATAEEAIADLETRMGDGLQHAKDLAAKSIAQDAADKVAREQYGREARSLAPLASRIQKSDRWAFGPNVRAMVGQRVVLWGHGSWRMGVAVWISPTGKRARVLYYTPTGGVEHFTNTSDFWLV